MRRSLIPLLAAAMTLAPATAASGNQAVARRPVVGPAPGQIGLPANAVVASSSGGSMEVRAPAARIEDVLRSTVDPTDVLTTMDAIRFLIEGETDVRLPDLRPAHTRDGNDPRVLPPEGSESPDDPPPPEPEPEPAGTQSFPSPAGDLSGDGLADLLTYEVTLPEETVQIRALRGTDGAELWTLTLEDIADAVSEPAGDLTGDGVDDFLLLGLEIHSESAEEDCPEDSFDHCRYDYAAEYTWLAGVLSGADGSVAWSRTYPGSVGYHYLFEDQDDAATGRFRVEESLSSRNLDVLPYQSGDHDGDGLDDLVLESLDLDYDIKEESERTVVVYKDTGSFDVSSSTRAEVITGDRGRVLLARTSRRSPTVATLEPTGDIVGGPAPDLLWQEATYTPDTYSCLYVGVGVCTDEPETTISFAMQAIDGATLDPAWRAPIEQVDDAFAFSLKADLSGDAKDDVAMLTLSYADTETFATRLYSGADGELLWERKQGQDSDWWEFPMVIDAYGGGEGQDVLLASFVGDPWDDGGIRLSRVDGATGQTLFETTRRLHRPVSGDHDVDFAETYVWGTDDVDGDGGGDIVAGGINAGLNCEEPEPGWCVVWWPPSPGMWTEIHSYAIVESGRAATVLHEREARDQLFYLEPTADLDGDARADAFEWDYPLDEDGTYTVTAERLAPTTPLWHRSFTPDEVWYASLWPGGDHDGAPGQEIIYGTNVEDAGRWTSLVASLAGATGQERWRIER